MTYWDKDRSQEFWIGRSRPLSGLRGVCLHTSEGNPNATADQLTNYQVGVQNDPSRAGSYNAVVDQSGYIIRQNTDDWQVWASGNRGNDELLHLCFTAVAAWTREEWLARDKMLRAGAKVVAHWIRLYGFPVRKVTTGTLPGILGHVDTRAWGGTNHTDPGQYFPYPEFLQMVLDHLNPPAPTPGDAVSQGLNETVTAMDGTQHTVKDLIRYTDGRVYELSQQVPEIDAKLDEILALLHARE